MSPLMKLLSAEQTRNADQFTIENEPVASIDLMERASTAFVKGMETEIELGQRVAVISGPGNNGGDGFAIARILKDQGVKVDSYFVDLGGKLSTDCEINKQRLDHVQEIGTEIPDFATYDLLIDAIFGSGLSRPVNGGLAKDVIHAMNESPSKIISVDIPSGLFCDEVLNDGIAIHSDLTISFQRPKLSFFFPESGKFIRRWKVVDIGLDEHFIQSQESSYFLVDHSIESLVHSRTTFSHKGTYGHALIVAGSYGMMGAAVLSTKASLKSGAGLVSAYIPKCGYTILQTAVPEAMCMTDENEKYIQTTPSIGRQNCMGIGPGLGRAEETKNVIRDIFQIKNLPLVIDADALNILSESPELLNDLPENAILTPHPLEFQRLVGKWDNTTDRICKQREFARQHKCVLVLKGAYTTITSPDGRMFINLSGNPGMATAGSGDVLTGIITGLRAQGYSALDAAILGVYFHGKSGDDAKKQIGEAAIIASDLISYLRIESKTS